MISRLKLIVGLVLIGGLFLLLDPERIGKGLDRLQPDTILFVVGLTIAGIAIQAVKWQILLRARHPDLTRGQSLESLFVGFGLGCLSPGRLGELGRGLLFPGHRLEWAGLAAVDRLGSTAVTGICALVGLFVLHPVAALACSTAVLAVGGLFRLGFRMCLMRFKLLQTVEQLLGKLSRQVLLANVGWSLVFNLVFFIQFWLILTDMGPVPIAALAAVPSVFALKAFVPISLFDIGVREGAAILVLAPFGIPAELAFTAALCLFAANVALPGIAGLCVILRRWEMIGSLRGAR